MKRKSVYNPHNAAKYVQKLERNPAVQRNGALRNLCKYFLMDPLEGLFHTILECVNDLGINTWASPRELRVVQKDDLLTQGLLPFARDKQSKIPITLHEYDLFQNLLLIGDVHAGKTTTLRDIVMQLVDLGVNVLVFQKKRHQFEYLQSRLGREFTLFNLRDIRSPFFDAGPELDPMDRFDLYDRNLDHLTQIMSMEHSRSIAAQGLKVMFRQWPEERIQREGHPTLIDLIKCIDSLQVEAERRKLKSSILNVLWWLWDKNCIYHARQGMYVVIRDYPTIIRYGDGQDYEVLMLCMLFIERFVHENDILPPDQMRKVVIIFDDAQELINQTYSGRLPVLVQKLNLLRESWLGVILAFQTIEGADQRILTSVGNRLIGSNKDHGEAVRLVESLGLHPSYADMVLSLQPGQFLMRTPSSEGAVAIQVHPFDYSKNINREQWQCENKIRKQQYTWRGIPERDASTEESARKRAGSDAGWETARRVLMHLALAPYGTATELREMSSVSAKTFSKALDVLQKLNFITKHSIAGYDSYEIKPEGWKAVNLTPKPHAGGFTHAFAVSRIVRCLEEQGYYTRTEDMLPPSDHRIDVVAQKDHQQLAVEFETGSSHVIENAKSCCRTSATGVIVVVATIQQVKRMRTRLQTDAELSGHLRSQYLQVVPLRHFMTAGKQEPQGDASKT